MTALIQSRMQKPRFAKYDLQPVAANAKGFKNGLAMMITAGPNAGFVEAANLTDTGVVIGMFSEDFDNTGGANGAITVNVEYPRERVLQGLDNDTTAPITAAMKELPCFALDDHTVSAAESPVTAGVVYGVSADGKTVWVEALFAAASGSNPDAPPAVAPVLAYGARAVITTLAAYAAVAGVLTASANGAIGAQDGIALAVGDVVLLPTDKATTATDAGPYVVQAVGAAGAKYKLARPYWYAFGATIPSGLEIKLGAEGTKYGGSTWKALVAAKTFVVDTTDGAFYPRLQTVTTVAMIAGVSAANSTLYVAPNAQVSPIPVTPGGTQGILRVSTQTSGAPGTSSLVATSSNAADTSTVKLNVINF